MTPGLPLDRTQAVVRQLEDALKEVDEELSANTEGGKPLVLRVLTTFASNVDVKDNGPHTATITVDLLNSEERNVSADEMLKRWRTAVGPIPDLVQANFTQTALGPGGNDLEVELFGPDLTELELAADDLLGSLLARDDVTAAYQNFHGARLEIRLTLNEFAYVNGLTPQSVVSQLRAAFSGTETDSFRVGQSGMSVQVELGDSMPSIEDLEAFPITLVNGKQVFLGSIGDMDRARAFGQITRQNGMAVARIIGQIDRDATTSTEMSRVVVGDLAPSLKDRFPGVSVEIGGGAEAQQEFQNSIMAAFLLGLIGVYIVLAFQFRSYALPLMIMLSIPFAIVGMVFGHLLMGLDISMPSLIGFASLAGVVVNNSILFVTFFMAAIREDDYLAAAIQAVRSRFRPALLSSLTTFIGLMPILTETSPQAQVLVPLVVSVAFGLLSSTLIVAFVFPCILGIYFDFKDVRTWLAGFEAKAAGDNP